MKWIIQPANRQKSVHHIVALPEYHKRDLGRAGAMTVNANREELRKALKYLAKEWDNDWENRDIDSIHQPNIAFTKVGCRHLIINWKMAWGEMTYSDQQISLSLQDMIKLSEV